VGLALVEIFKADPSLKSFVFTLKNPRDFPPRKFALKAEMKHRAIVCDSSRGPNFGDIGVVDKCNANTDSYTNFCACYVNDTGPKPIALLDSMTFFTGSQSFTVKEIEVFEITD
jgi:hypothetical protein